MGSTQAAWICMILAAWLPPGNHARSMRIPRDVRDPNANEVILAIDDVDKKQYLEANFESNAYEFGYEVGPSGQFHHENRGPDGVTYGCYGYINPFGVLQATHFIADSAGYRIVQPDKPAKVYAAGRVPGVESDGQFVSDADQPRKIGHITPWKELYFPPGCGKTPGGIPIGGKPKPNQIPDSSGQDTFSRPVTEPSRYPGGNGIGNENEGNGNPTGNRPNGSRPSSSQNERPNKPGGRPNSNIGSNKPNNGHKPSDPYLEKPGGFQPGSENIPPYVTSNPIGAQGQNEQNGSNRPGNQIGIHRPGGNRPGDSNVVNIQGGANGSYKPGNINHLNETVGSTDANRPGSTNGGNRPIGPNGVNTPGGSYDNNKPIGTNNVNELEGSNRPGDRPGKPGTSTINGGINESNRPSSTGDHNRPDEKENNHIGNNGSKHPSDSHTPSVSDHEINNQPDVSHEVSEKETNGENQPGISNLPSGLENPKLPGVSDQNTSFYPGYPINGNTGTRPNPNNNGNQQQNSGGNPSPGSNPSDGQPISGGNSNQGKKPYQGGKPSQTSKPNQGGDHNHGGKPSQEGRPSQGGHPSQGIKPTVGVKPNEGGQQSQGGRPGVDNNANGFPSKSPDKENANQAGNEGNQIGGKPDEPFWSGSSWDDYPGSENPGESATGVHPPSHLGNGSQKPNRPLSQLHIIPYPLPALPKPASCPCYLVDHAKHDLNSTANNDNHQQFESSAVFDSQNLLQGNSIPIGIVGFVPVVFFPYCSENETNEEFIKEHFPTAFPMAYPCNQCYSSDLSNALNSGNQNYFLKVLSQANIDTNNFDVKSPPRQRQRRRRLRYLL